MKINDFVKEGFYINLDYKTERNIETIKELKKHNLDGFIKRYNAVKAFNQTVECEYGTPEWLKCTSACTASHVNIIKYAKEKKLDKILVLEDDIAFINEGSESPISIIEKSLDSLSKIEDWQIIYLGGYLMPDSILKKIDENLVSIKSGGILSTHAYIMHESAYDIILNKYQTNIHVPADLFLNGCLNKKFSSYPCAAVQRGFDKNDIGGKQTINYKAYINSYINNVRKNDENTHSIINEKMDKKILNIKGIDLNEESINNLDLSELAKLIISENDRSHFLMNCGTEHYKLLSFLSLNFKNNVILDIGTNTGLSALASSYNNTNKIVSFDLFDKLNLKSKNNIDFIIDDILDEKYSKLIDNSSLILLDTYHDGTFETVFLDHLVKTNWKGLLFLDDINLNDEMRKFWLGIQQEKYDITKYGHWTGSGLVIFE
jgi:GR25 family glycosyltransferase involved in LPS biosynthesis